MRECDDNPGRRHRRLVIKLGLAALLVISGCTTMRENRELTSALNELRLLLDRDMETADGIRLQSILERIEIRGRELVAEHRVFLDGFDRMLSLKGVTEDELLQTIDAYENRRRWLRNDLLALQDELHDAVSPDQWQEMLKILNRAGRSFGQLRLVGV